MTGPLATAETGDNQVTDWGYRVTDNPQFRVELNRPKDDVAVVELRGEVDLFTAPQFKDVLFQAIGEEPSRVVVDLAEVTFIDSTAITVVVGGVRAVTAYGGSLELVCPEGHVRRTFEITGLAQIVPIHTSRNDSLAAVPEG